MTRKEINAAYWLHVEGYTPLEGWAEALARRVLAGCSTNYMRPSDECIFVQVEVERMPEPKQYEIQIRSSPSLQQMVRKCLGFFDPGKRKTIKITPQGVFVNDSFSDHVDVEMALAEAMVIEWRKDKER